MTYEEWLSEHSDSVEREYQLLHDEYGDALTCSLCQYKEQKYREYVEAHGGAR